MKTIISVVGARPQFIKASVVDIELRKRIAAGENINHHIIHTGQHFDANMSDIFFKQLALTPPFAHMNINGGSHGSMTARMLSELEAFMVEHKPSMCMVYGDTNSTLAAALAAVKLNIPVAHVEAGMRRYDNSIPEEVNRRLTDQICSLFFCSSNTYAENLRKENLSDGIHICGDVTYDSFLQFKNLAQLPKSVEGLENFVACTVHRPINTDDPKRLANVLECLRQTQKTVVLPLHPRTRQAVDNHGLKWPNNVLLLEPVSYFEMIALVMQCDFVVTDSGGLQKDAAFAGKKCLTFLQTTPWKELLELDVQRAIDDRPDELVKNLDWAMESISDFNNPYGDGSAAAKICDAVTDYIL